MAVDLVGNQGTEHLCRIFQLTNHDLAISQAVSILNRTGHARFRRGPSDPQTSSSSVSLSHAPALPAVTRSEPALVSKECFSKSINTNSASTSTSSIIGGGDDDSVHNGKKASSLSIITPAPTFSSRKPPLPSSHRKRSASDRVSLEGSARDHSLSRGCHCCKRRKLPLKIKKVPITGSKVASIPADEYSWKKYGEKRIDGSPFPRVYYRCSTAAGCHAKKRVELTRGESKVLIVTYEGEHKHAPRPAPVPMSLTADIGNSIQSK